jgi:DNA-binding CsgD family transcriptional regulator
MPSVEGARMGSAVADRAARATGSIARWCRQANHAGELLEGVATRLRPILDQDAGGWLVTDPATVLFTDGFIEGFAEDTCGPWFHHELSVPDVATFADLSRQRTPVARLSDATGGQPATSARWREVLEPAGFGRELRVAFREGGHTWGVATVHRASERPDFTPEDASLLAEVSPVVAAGLRRLVLRERVLADDPEGPGLLLVGPDHVARPGTPAGARWLELLGLPHGAFQQTWLLTLGELATGGGTARRRVRVRDREGRWVTLHAEPMSDEDTTFAVIVEPSRPADIAGIAALAYGLSPREQELVLALARGEGTEQIAERLCISPHTVRDHLKSIFEKTGVGSRNALLARLFHDHYAESFFDRVTAH